ncbi:MAG: hypothetical protein R2710_31180 [Acidimicrobiales bacterium]
MTGSPHPSPEWPDLMDDLAERVDAAFDDPIIFDAALNEGGLFRRFLVDRGALLPPDEYLLASAWVTVTRSVHEILSVEPGTGLVVRDLATGDQYQVRERIFSHDAVVGARICARVVPDGQAHQLLGSVIGVPTGREEPLLDLCADGDPFELCAYIGALLAPPTIVRRPGMLDEMLDHQALDRVMSSVDGSNEDAVMAALNEELSRQFRVRWLDEQVPALGGVTPRGGRRRPGASRTARAATGRVRTIDRAAHGRSDAGTHARRGQRRGLVPRAARSDVSRHSPVKTGGAFQEGGDALCVVLAEEAAADGLVGVGWVAETQVGGHSQLRCDLAERCP